MLSPIFIIRGFGTEEQIKRKKTDARSLNIIIGGVIISMISDIGWSIV